MQFEKAHSNVFKFAHWYSSHILRRPQKYFPRWIKLGDFLKLLWLSQNVSIFTQISVSPLRCCKWNDFCFFFPNGQEASSAVELLSSGPVKKLEFLCEIKWQSNKIPAVTIYHTQHWTYQLYEQLLLAIVYKHPMALVHNGANKISEFIFEFLSSPFACGRIRASKNRVLCVPWGS